MGSLTPDSIRSTNPNDNNEKNDAELFLRNLFHLRVLFIFINRVQDVEGYLSLLRENFTTHQEFRLRETIIRGTRCRGILKREHPMYLTCRDPTSATWFPVATVVIPSMCMSPR